MTMNVSPNDINLPNPISKENVTVSDDTKPFRGATDDFK